MKEENFFNLKHNEFITYIYIKLSMKRMNFVVFFLFFLFHFQLEKNAEILLLNSRVIFKLLFFFKFN